MWLSIRRFRIVSAGARTFSAPVLLKQKICIFISVCWVGVNGDGVGVVSGLRDTGAGPARVNTRYVKRVCFTQARRLKRLRQRKGKTTEKMESASSKWSSPSAVTAGLNLDKLSYVHSTVSRNRFILECTRRTLRTPSPGVSFSSLCHPFIYGKVSINRVPIQHDCEISRECTL